MSTPSGDEPNVPDGPNDSAGEPQVPDEVPFDPYRFGRPDHPIPPEYAPPGYVPDPVAPQAPSAQGYQPYPQYQQHPYGMPGAYGPHNPYGPAPYGQAPQAPQHHQYAAPKTGNGKAIASMVLGIASILLCWLLLIDAIVIIASVVFGIVTLVEGRSRGGEGKAMAIVGLVCSAIGTVAVVLTTVWFVHLSAHCGGIQNANQPGFEQCLRDHVNS